MGGFPLTRSIFTAFPQYEKATQYVGLVVAAVALLASAFVSQAWHLLVTIGIFYPFAGGEFGALYSIVLCF